MCSAPFAYLCIYPLREISSTTRPFDCAQRHTRLNPECRMEESSDLDAEIVRAVNQYLVLTGLNGAARALQNECDARHLQFDKTTPTCSQVKTEGYFIKKKRLIAHFERGESALFLRLWNELFPLGDGRPNAVSVLEFYIRVYFATFPLRKTPPARNEYRERIRELKAYLEEGAGSKLSATPELVQYFALPYVSEPGKHPVFKELVQKKWVKNVTDKLERHLTKHAVCIVDNGEPKLVQWMASYESGQSREGPSKEYRELQDDYYKLIDIAAELVDSLEQSSQGKTISADQLSDLSTRLLESNMEAERRMQKCGAGQRLVGRRNRSLKARIESKKKANSAVKKSESLGNLVPADPKSRVSPKMEEVKESTTLSPPAGLLTAQLNYTKIANHLIKNPSGRTSALLLQALRQQVTRVSHNSAVITIKAFGEKDVLSLKHRKTSVVASILNQGESASEVKEELARFLNAIGSMRTGRDYLLAVGQGRDLLAVLTFTLKAKRLHSFASDHILAALQKLSLRASVQKDLIQLGMLEWLACYLDTKLTNFALEYGSALLMNLCVNPASAAAASRISNRLLTTIVALLNNLTLPICKYLNGILYSILGAGRVRAKARELDLERYLKAKLDSMHCSDDCAQIPQLLKLLSGEVEIHEYKRSLNVEDNDAQEDDYLEAEIESTDMLRPAPNELYGSLLLTTKFSLCTPVDEEESLSREEITVPPGTVPRRTHRARHPASVHVKRRGVVEPKAVSLPSETASNAPNIGRERPSSICSHHTFILENDRRRPLVARNAFKSISSSTDSLPRKTTSKETVDSSPKSNFPQKVIFRQRTESDTAVKGKNAQNAANPPNSPTKSPTECADNKCEEVHPDVPVTTNVPMRIPDDANAYEYIAAFASRPKVLRTPDKERERRVEITRQPCEVVRPSGGNSLKRSTVYRVKCSKTTSLVRIVDEHD